MSSEIWAHLSIFKKGKIMDLKWLHDELVEEIHGALTYAKVAIELKAMSEKMAKTFYEMATQEAEHAKHLYDMAMEYYDKIVEPYSMDNIPTYLSDIKDKILECYTSKSIEVKLLLNMYKD